MIHHTDSMPTVQAWKRSKTGAFSSSARISTFLTGMSALDIELVFKPGVEMCSSDYYSRNPVKCENKRCQICKFAYEMEIQGDEVIPMIAKVTVEDIEQGRITMPFTQRSAWLKVQKNDKMHQQLTWLIDSSQAPEKKKTRGDNTVLKRLHNLYKNGMLQKSRDGLITVTHEEPGRGSSQAISIPTSMYPGLIQALHLKLHHPSKLQLLKLSSRYFYSPGTARIVEEVTSNCNVCAALKQLPPELFTESTVKNETFGSNYSADVIRREGQKIFLCREKLSQFSTSCIIQDEKADSLRDALVKCIIETIPDNGALVQVDCATAFQTLKAESENDGSILKKLKIKVDLGRSHNINKNPIAENAIKEFHKESLRICPRGGPLSEIERAMVTKSMNSRIRNRGFSPKEIAFQRDQITNQFKPISDSEMAEKQYLQRRLQHPVDVPKPKQFTVGENVFLKNDKSKLKSREMYKIVDIYNENNECWATLQKFDSQFRAKDYKVKTTEIFSVPVPEVKVQDTVEDNGQDCDVTSEPGDTQDLHESDAENQETGHHKEEKKPNKLQDDRTLDEEENMSNMKPSRTVRKSAKLAKNKFKDWASGGLLKITVPELKHPLPSHGWDWEAFKKMIEEEDTIAFKKVYNWKTTTRLPDEEYEEDRLSWDDSPEQYELMPGTEDEDFDNMMEPKKLFDSSEEEVVSLTSTSDDDVFFGSRNPLKFNQKLKRNLEIRRPKTLAEKSSQIGLDTPGTSSQVNLSQKQNLNRVLPKRKPILPETVMLGPQVQQFQTALASLRPPIDDPHPQLQFPRETLNDVHEDELVPDDQRQLRRSARLDYKRFNASGDRSFKSNE